MTPHDRWLLRTDTTTYAVTLGGDDHWAELAAWGPHGVEDGPSPMDWSRRTHFIVPADAAPAEYIPYGLRPFTGADLVASAPAATAAAGGGSPAPRRTATGHCAWSSPTTSSDCARRSATRRCPAPTSCCAGRS